MANTKALPENLHSLNEQLAHHDDGNNTNGTKFLGSEEEVKVLERVVWRKMDLWILPVVTMFYLLSFLDRSNVSNARIAGLQTDLKMSNRQYSIALTVTYVPYIAAELPSNLLLKIVGPNLMLPTLISIWGIITTMQGLVQSYQGLLVCRFFLGLFEGGLFPGIVLYLSFFYPRTRLQTRISTFFASASLSGAFSGLLAAAIINLNNKGGKPAWSWIFIIEGIFTFLFGSLSFFFVPSSPSHARFLTAREKEYVNARLREDGALSQDAQDDRFSWVEVWRCLQLPQVWFLAVAFFFDGTLIYALAYFEPTIVAGLGYKNSAAQLRSVPPFAAAFVVSIITAVISDRYQCRGLVGITVSSFCLIGFAMFLGSDSKGVQYGSLFLSVTGAYCAAPAFITWNANNTAPHVRRATAVAIGFIMTNAGGILATWLLGSLSPAPRYTEAAITFIIFSVGMMMFATINLWYIVRENRRKATIRATSSKEDEPKGLGDRSAWFIYSL